MCDKCYRCTESDAHAAYEIESFLSRSTPEQARALHFVSEGSVRESIESAVSALISKGNEALAAEFPGLATQRQQPRGDPA